MRNSGQLKAVRWQSVRDTNLLCCLQNMVEARNANYATILRHLSFAKRGAPNVELEGEGQGSGRSERQHVSADTYDNGSDSDTEAPEPRLLRVRLSVCALGNTPCNLLLTPVLHLAAVYVNFQCGISCKCFFLCLVPTLLKCSGSRAEGGGHAGVAGRPQLPHQQHL